MIKIKTKDEVIVYRKSKVTKINRGPWSHEEDEKLKQYVKEYGPSNWVRCREFVPERNHKQIRERWHNVLSSDIKKAKWTITEEYLIFKLYKEFGSNWSNITKFIPGRSDNSIKNRFLTSLRKVALSNCTNNNCTAETMLKLNKNQLLVFFNIAYNEKTKYIDYLLKKLSISIENALSIDILNEIVKADFKKRSINEMTKLPKLIIPDENKCYFKVIRGSDYNKAIASKHLKHNSNTNNR